MKKEGCKAEKAAGQRMRKYRLFISYQKERRWLEQMALEGWFLTDIRVGVCYTFEKGEPCHLLYDIDQFRLSKNPTLEEIHRKEIFLEMAKELGWHEVTHDEAMVYYFAKRYEEGGINELHNDLQSRKQRAAKFRVTMEMQGSQMVFWGMIVLLMDIAANLVLTLKQAPSDGWYNWLALAFVLYSNLCGMWYRWYALRCEKELLLTRREWEDSMDPSRYKTVRKLILTNRGLSRFLEKQAAEGFALTAMTAVRYFFEESTAGRQIYTMDSERLVNKRLRARHRQAIEDGKDWNGWNNDWEIQSVRDAQEAGWHFVCALENRMIIYRGASDDVRALNDPRDEKGFRGVSLIGKYGLVLLCSGALGAVVGFLIA